MLVYCLHGLCEFPYMVSNVNITTKSGIIRRKEEACCRQMLTMLGYHLYGNYCKYTEKVQKNEEKKNRHDVALFDNVEVQFNGLHAFPNTVINVSIARKSEQIRKKWRHLR